MSSAVVEQRGACACGAVRFAADVAHTSRCGCDWCRRVGWWGARIDADAFRLLAGWELLERVPGPLSRLRCGACGVDAFAEAGDTVSVNVRCLDRPDALPITRAEH